MADSLGSVPPRVVLTSVWVAVVLWSAVQAEEDWSEDRRLPTETSTPPSVQLDVILDLCGHLFCGCVSFVHSPGPSGDDMTTATYQLRMQQALSNRGVFSSVLSWNLFNSGQKDAVCNRNRPLYVVLSWSEITRLYLQNPLRLSGQRWLLFLDDTASWQDDFRDVNIPFDCELLVAQQSEDHVSLTEVYRVSAGLPLQTYGWGLWSVRDGLRGPSASIHERRNNLQGIRLKASIASDFSLKVRVDETSRYLSVGGYCSDIWVELKRRHNFTYEVEMIPMVSRGAKQLNGSWNGLIGRLLRNEANLTLNLFSMTEARALVVDFSIPLLTSRSHVFIRTPEASPSDWFGMLLPFTGGLWLAVALSFLLIACSLAIFQSLGRLHAEESNKEMWKYDGLSNSLFVTWAIFTQQGQEGTPRIWILRIVYLTAFITYVTLFACYTAKFMAHITMENKKLPFTDLKGLLADGRYKLDVRAGSGILTIFQNSSNTLVRSLYERSILPNINNLPRDVATGINRLCSNDHYAFMEMDEKMSSEVDSPSCSISTLPAPLFNLHLVMIFSKEDPYRGLFKKTLQTLLRNGIVERIYQRNLRAKVKPGKPALVSVHLDNVKSMFLVLLVGVVISVLIFLVEVKRG